MDIKNAKIAVIGLGYVGLPLAVEFATHRQVVGFDISGPRVDQLRAGRDTTLEISDDELAQTIGNIHYTLQPDELRDCGIFIITVPTPIDSARRPDLSQLIRASELVAKVMPDQALVIYESTVYPGATEEVCVPVLERVSGKKFNDGFYCGYSPERINPGDKSHRLTAITKVTAGSTAPIGKVVDQLYASIITAGTYLAPSIRVAEAAKVIENTQRDLNIALMNELSLIFNRLGLDTLQVLEAAETKWNFLPFRPGLVGGHCIGVDPYYLTHKAQEVGYHPEVVLAGRRINDAMGNHIADEVIKLLLDNSIEILKSRVLVLGLTFKENCPDLRNTRVVDCIRRLEQYAVNVDIFDPWIDVSQARREYGLECLAELPKARGQYDAIILTVAHDYFRRMAPTEIRDFGKPNSIIYDVKGMLPISAADGRL